MELGVVVRRRQTGLTALHTTTCYAGSRGSVFLLSDRQVCCRYRLAKPPSSSRGGKPIDAI